MLAVEDKLTACGADRSPEEAGGRRRLVRPLQASSLCVSPVRLRWPLVARVTALGPLCGPRAVLIRFWTRTQDPRPRDPHPQPAHGGGVPAAVMAVAAAARDAITHPSQVIARRVLRLSERPLAHSARKTDDAHGGVRRTPSRGRCEERGQRECSALIAPLG